jgi:hypothetical protein
VQKSRFEGPQSQLRNIVKSAFPHSNAEVRIRGNNVSVKSCGLREKIAIADIKKVASFLKYPTFFDTGTAQSLGKRELRNGSGYYH